MCEDVQNIAHFTFKNCRFRVQGFAFFRIEIRERGTPIHASELHILPKNLAVPDLKQNREYELRAIKTIDPLQ